MTIQHYAEFMHSHRALEDGSLRDSDNWQKGIPRAQLMKSLLRHVNDLHLHHRGYEDLAVETVQDSLCAIVFNALGYLRHELLDTDDVPSPTDCELTSRILAQE